MHIIGKHLLLRNEPHTQDREDLFRWCNLEEWNYYDEPDAPFQPISREEFRRAVITARAVVPGSQLFEIETLEGQHLGWVVCYSFDEAVGSIYVGIDLPEAEIWGKDYGTEALHLWVNYLFRELHLREIRLKTWTGNARMRRTAEKCGFKEVARMPHRAAFSIRGEALEFVEYTIPSTE